MDDEDEEGVVEEDGQSDDHSQPAVSDEEKE